MDWRHRAICRDEDPELFFPISDDGPSLPQIAEAKSVCLRCPVIRDCRDWARAAGMTGIWGGTTEDERNALPVPGFRVRFPGPSAAKGRTRTR
jgi:WhiB family transcriptional regulator, redox-sensing transcriptional regulator